MCSELVLARVTQNAAFDRANVPSGGQATGKQSNPPQSAVLDEWSGADVAERLVSGCGTLFCPPVLLCGQYQASEADHC